MNFLVLLCMRSGHDDRLLISRSRLALVLVFQLVASGVAVAQVQLANVFADRMVLQRELPVPVWGTADPGASVQVAFDGQSHTTIADEQGRWRVTLAAMKASASPRELVVQSEADRVVRKNVWVGEVWLAAGQSNMAYTTRAMASRLAKGQDLVSAADFPAIRFCRINEPDSPQPLDDLPAIAQWDVCTPQNVLQHSAVAFVFARRLHQALQVPIGVIDCSWGGKPIEPFIPVDAFVGHPTLVELAARAKTGDFEGIQTMPGGTYVRSSSWLAGTIYNGRIAPLVPYAIRGAIWYQGESNSGKGEDPRDYEHKMRALVEGWRHAWDRDRLPVYFVQLPQWSSYAWTYLREQQRRAQRLPHTGMVVTIDLDNGNDIHPPNKIDVGERLARWPLANVYGREIEASGPMFREAKIRDGTATVSFEHAESGLMVGRVAGVQSIQPSHEDRLNGFELIGPEGRWYAAEARIEGGTVVVSSPEVTQPIAVRYACHPEAEAGRAWNLYSREGLPASPFCSDWNLMPYDPDENPMPKK
ncbi:sialate O-acetylesterase [Stieleria neptunia]|uniref:sialate O-acetylesterase n=1 Tax=Stieleria neptunia TaxID=2527979 RepID=UPI001E540ED8|nr:sialate O-acetylesterase [Stieleria neptunia]